MTAEQFNEKYAAYLEPGHYGLAISGPKQIEYLDKLFEELTQIPGFTFSQIKWKFGSYRFYCSNVISAERKFEIEDKLKELEK